MPAQKLLEGITNAYIIADKAYFSKENIKFLEQNKNKAVIPARENYTKNHNIDRHLYKDI